ncbi:MULTISPECIES: VOC family protein [Rhodococcus]|jgi:PhnB protein|uniref:VOC family protein n=1 Tax=Rhodococcus oxybenzonivorans TaxID=1990687 RepID=A0AAE4UVL5_9NOCA|nr:MULTISPECIES: VOC family protein [Rhodococcus]MDV7243985.1 VOC family protein [Rhodococcus oxybenzonivorans]MDV7263756.1 VOC family protein [Rhodococcus oxybenzonivorans]MDV7274773.1 VOC family protein [Rhodococcus oxybenzonivorans]MDV7335012.1 VOC family protein [Rhodococcus oxybenzonivorans]MDV7345723.1 VOC family protein [Rhodococcus oxybenzonivorans]
MSSAVPVPGAVPYLTVRRGTEAVEWYSAVFGARVVGEPIVLDDGRIGHVELQLPTGMIYLAEEFPEMGLTAPEAGSTSVSLMLAVDDPDAVLLSARDAGGTVERWISEGHGHRNATLIDPFGHRWMLVGP